MELFVKLWQRIHYNVYRFNVFNQIYVIGLPFTLLYRNNRVKKLFETKKRIKNPEQFFRKILTDPKNSTVMWLSDSFMAILICILAFSSINFVSALLGKITVTNKILFIVILFVPSLVFNYYLLWKNDKYLIYFKEFEKESKAVKRKWAWISFGVVVGIILLLIASFWIMTQAIH